MSAADLVVVGGGPAGLAVAVRARMAGLEAVVLERSSPPIDRACGEGVMPEGARELVGMGVQIDPAEAHPFIGIRYLAGPWCAEATFGAGAGLGVRRTVLHQALARRAAELGADLRWGTEVSGLTDRGVVTGSGEVAGRWIVAADGRNSRVRRWSAIATVAHRAGRFGVRRHVRLAPWTDRVEVHWGSGCEAYVTPVGPELVGVALMWSGRVGGFDDVLLRLPRLAERLAGAPVANRDAGAGPFGGRARDVVAGRTVLVGDAACCLDPITGEGLSLAFQSARALVAAVVAGRLDRYRQDQSRLVRPARRLNRLVLLLAEAPRLRARVVRALAARPDVFDRLLAARRGSVPTTVGALLRLSPRLLATGAR